MWLLFRFLSLRYWLRHRAAFSLAMAGVALGMAVFVAIQVANHSVFSSFQASLDAIAGKATLQIEGGNNGLPDATFARIKKLHDPRIHAAAPILSRTFFSPTLKTSLLLLGVDVFSESEFRDFSFDSAGQNANTPNARESLDFLLDPRAIAISDAMARRHKLPIGSRLSIFIGARKYEFRVAHILRGNEVKNAYGGDFALLDIAAAQEAFRQVGRLSRIDLRVEENNIAEITRVLAPLLPRDASIRRPAQRGAEVAGMLQAFRLNLSALSCIAIFVGAFLIYNAIASSIVRRRGEVGILRSVGASPFQLRAMFLLESGCIGLLGSLLGLLFGILLARFALQAVSTTVSSLYVAVKARELFVPVWLLWGAPFGGMLLAIAAALPAAWEAAAISPRAATLDFTLHFATARFALPLAGMGGALICLAALLCHPFISTRSPLFGFTGAACTLAGFALLAPLATLHFSRAITRLVGALCGIEGILACSQLRRALGRSSLVIAALMVALALTVGLGVMVRSFRTSVEDWVSFSIRGDLYIATATGFSGDPGPGLPREVVDYVRSMRAVKIFDSIRGAEMTLKNRFTGGTFPIFIAANDLPALESNDRAIRFLETADGDEAALRAHLDATGALISERFKNLLGYRAGESVLLPTPQGKKSFFIAGVFYDYTPNEAVIYLPRTLYKKFWRDEAIDALALHLRDEYAVRDIKRDLENKFAQKYHLTLLSNAEIRRSVFDTFDQTFAITYALQLIAVLVAAVGIFDTLWSLLLERRREMAMLRSMGASSQQIIKATLIELGLIGVCGWGLGLLAGLCLAWQLIFIINRQFFGWTIGWTLSGDVLYQSLLLSLLASLGAGIFPILQAARGRLATALQRD